MIPLVVLAAGAGRRFGAVPKLHARVLGRSVLAWTLLHAARATTVVLPVDAALPSDVAPSSSVTVIRAPRAAGGMAFSLADALEQLRCGDAPGCVVLLGDDPLAAVAVPAVLTAARADPNTAVAVRRTLPVPHPVYLPRSLWQPAIDGASTSPDAGPARLLAGESTIWLDGSGYPEPCDVDSPEDMLRLERALASATDWRRQGPAGP